MRIVLDLQGAQTASRFRGIGRYSFALARAMVANRGSHEVLIALNGLLPDTIEPIRAAFDFLLPQENIRVWAAPGPVRDFEPANASRRKIAEPIREAFLASLEPDVVHVSSLFEGYGDDAVTSIGEFAPHLPTAVTLYDLIPLAATAPDPNPTFREYYARKLQSLRRADLLLGISLFSCSQAISLLHLNPNRVVNVRGAADHRFKRISLSDAERARIRETYGLQKPFICWVGTAVEPRKNIVGLIRAFIQLPPLLRSKFQILIIGKLESGDIIALKRTLRAFKLHPHEVVFTDYVSDDDLPLIYNMCHAFVFPSLLEGFGLPALEAMQCGAPVIASNTSSIPEVVEFEQAMFDPHSADDLTDKLRRVLTDDEFRANLTSHHLRQATKFSWNESANRAIKAFEGLHELKRTRTLTTVATYDDLIARIAGVLKEAMDEPAVISTAMAIAQNHPEPRYERVLFVDVSELSQRDANTGVQRVTRSLLKQLLEKPPRGYSVKPVYGTQQSPGYRYATQFTRDFLGEQGGGQATLLDLQQGDIFLGLDLQHEVVMKNQGYLSSMRDRGVRVYFLIYDLLPVHFPSYFPRGAEEDHHRWLSVVSQADGVICVSRTVADEYIEWLSTHKVPRQRPLRIGWSHSGADLTVSAPSRQAAQPSQDVLRSLTNAPSFLMVGTIEPRKGYCQGLAAFEQLWAKRYDLRLVVVGKRGWEMEQLIKKLNHHPELGSRLFWLEDVSDEYLEKIYAACSCLIAASEGEGFGLPLIEAAQHKLPILARDIPVFHEVTGNHASFFQGSTPEELAHAIIDWLELHAEGRHPRSEDIPRMTWEQSAERLKEILFGDDWYAIWPAEGQGRLAVDGDHGGIANMPEASLA